jgi:hypothetical protein
MHDSQASLADHLERLAQQVRQGTVKSVFAVAIGQDGPAQAILVAPEERESIIIAINDETTRMLGSPIT